MIHTDIDDLVAKADTLAGRTVGEVAASLDRDVPDDLRSNKGWVGQLVEHALGARAGNAAGPDFPELGVELKTLPVDRMGRPLESTYVCTVPLATPDDVEWEDSVARKKLACVLWVPVLAERQVALSQRTFGRPMLWRMDDVWESALRRDWESHLDAVRHGAADNIRGTDGEFLQVRPKAADASRRTWTIDERGESIMTSPRGFYLRALFTEMLLRQHFMLPNSDQ